MRRNSRGSLLSWLRASRISRCTLQSLPRFTKVENYRQRSKHSARSLPRLFPSSFKGNSDSFVRWAVGGIVFLSRNFCTSRKLKTPPRQASVPEEGISPCRGLFTLLCTCVAFRGVRTHTHIQHTRTHTHTHARTH